MRLIAFSRPAALVVALRRGLFAAEGLDVTVARTSSSRAQLDALLKGEHDVAHTAADNVVARVDAGDDLRIVLIADRGVEHQLVGAPAVLAPRDLRGRRLGVDAPESGHAILAYVLLAEAGVPRGTYEIVPVGSTRDRYEALVAGRIDAAMLNAPHDEKALAMGCHVLADASARFPDHPGLTVVVRDAWARTHRTEITRYCRALIAAARFAAEPAHRAEVIDDLAADAAVDRETARRRYERERRGPVPSIDEMKRSVGSVLVSRAAAGLRPGDGVVERYFDPSYALDADPALATVRS